MSRNDIDWAGLAEKKAPAGNSKVPTEHRDYARSHPGEWVEIPGRYTRDPSSWTSEVAAGHFGYLGGETEQWYAQAVRIATVPLDEQGRPYHRYAIMYEGPRR